MFTIAATAAFISATPAFAKECCDAATAKAKTGETCEKCEKHPCCQAASKTAAADLKKAGKAVDCKVCAAKKDAKKPA